VIRLVIALRISRSKKQKSGGLLIVDVKVVVLKKYLVPACRKVAATRRELYFV
jgi:hypothetical protein